MNGTFTSYAAVLMMPAGQVAQQQRTIRGAIRWIAGWCQTRLEASGWRAQINPRSTREPMTAAGTGHTVIDVRPAAASGEAGEPEK
jgi:hypothetical protein